MKNSMHLPYHRSATTDVADNKERKQILSTAHGLIRKAIFFLLGKSAVTCLLQCSHITFWFCCCWHSQKKREKYHSQENNTGSQN